MQPLTGAYVAKLNKQKIMVITDVIRGLIITFLAVNVITGNVNTYMIYGCTFCLSLVETLRLPAANAIIPLIIEPNDYSSGISLSGTINRVCELVGAALGGLIVSLLGVQLAITIDALSFFISALFIALMKVRESISEIIRSASFIKNLNEGIKYVLSNQFIFIVTVIASLGNLMLVPLNALEAAFVSTYYHGNAIYLSLMSICITIGSLIGGLIYPFMKNKLSNQQLCISIFVGCGFYYLALVFSGLFIKPYIYISVALSSMICGLIVTAASSHLSVLLMEKTDANFLSRVGALNNALGVAFMPLASFLIAFIAQYIDVVTLFICIGIITFIMSVMALISHKLELLNE